MACPIGSADYKIENPAQARKGALEEVDVVEEDMQSPLFKYNGEEDESLGPGSAGLSETSSQQVQHRQSELLQLDELEKKLEQELRSEQKEGRRKTKQ